MQDTSIEFHIHLVNAEGRQAPVPWTRILGGDTASALSIAAKRSITDFDLWMLDGSNADRVAKVRGGEVMA